MNGPGDGPDGVRLLAGALARWSFGLGEASVNLDNAARPEKRRRPEGKP